MSWQTYVDDHLMGDIEGHRLAAAAILGHDDSVWAQSSAFPQLSRIPPCIPSTAKASSLAYTDLKPFEQPSTSILLNNVYSTYILPPT
ncbi:hypothetical protein SLEP1_g36398 [Rubroshorea leprosula]|uniref:Profilin n=1 Tax=Rubroshorea leprosula TaxID=152421 RepID=A0AAV5KRS0_9ROSI|nr:hypothetical protein SLEP1_g36398 [Rubroshorea leprosula]